MAIARLSQVYVAEVFDGDMQNAQLELNKLITSGVAYNNPKLQSLMVEGGIVGEISNFEPLTAVEPNYSNDDPTIISVPKSIGSRTQAFRHAPRNFNYGSSQLARDLGLQDPMAAIVPRLAKIATTDIEKRVIYSLQGILADNIANDNEDMVYIIGTDANSAIGDAERISAESVIWAKQTLGDQQGELAILAVHSAIYARLQIQQLIDFIPSGVANITIPTFMGLTLIYDDSMPVEMGTYRPMYTSFLLGMNSISIGQGIVGKPSEIISVPGSGNGAGEEQIWTRHDEVIHIDGFSFLSAVLQGISADYDDLKEVTNWNRKWDRKHIPIAFLQTNG